MKVTNYEGVEEGVPYVPDFLNNRELPPEEQILVWVKPLNNKMKKKYARQMKIKQDRKTEQMQTNAVAIDKIIFTKHVVKIENLTIFRKKTGEEVECTDALMCYEEAPDDLVDDIVKAIEDQSHLDEGKKTD